LIMTYVTLEKISNSIIILEWYMIKLRMQANDLESTYQDW
jgi:hypothetical protein